MNTRLAKLGTIAMVAVLGLTLGTVTGCSKSDTADAAVGWLEKGLKDGSVFEKLSMGERLAFSRLKRGLRSKGKHVLEGMGVQYRVVRVESIDPAADELREKNEDGNWDDFVPEGLRKKVSDGDYLSVALVSIELTPGEKWLKENATDLIIGGRGGGANDFVREFWLVKDSQGWGIVSKSARRDAQALMSAYKKQKSLKDKVTTRELAERLISKAPKDEDE